MSPHKPLAFHADVTPRQSLLKVQVPCAAGGLAVLVASLWCLHRSEVSDVQFVLGMLAATAVSLVIVLGGFAIAARRNLP